MARVHLTKAFVEAIEPTDRLLTFTDDRTRGLTLLVTPGGVRTFYLTRKFRGRVERNKLGRFPECTLAMARSRAAHLHVRYDSGENAAELVRQRRVETTLDQFFEIYYREHCALRNKRPDYARYTYAHYLSPAFGARKLSEIRRADVTALHQELGRSGRLRTANKAQALLRAILNKAIAWEYLHAENAAQHVMRFRETARDRFMSEQEVARWHEGLACEPPLLRDFFLVLLYTGARKSEVLTMEWDHIDLATGVWRIPLPKNLEPRRVVLAGPVLEILLRRQSDGRRSPRWVFPGRVAGAHLNDPKRAWGRLTERAQLHDLRIHDLRRTHGSWLLAGGADLQIIAKALGHKDLETTRIYARLTLDPVREHVERMTTRLSDLAHNSRTAGAQDDAWKKDDG